MGAIEDRIWPDPRSDSECRSHKHLEMLVDVQRAVASENMAVLAAGIAIGGLTVGLLLRRGAGGGLLQVRSTTNSGSGGSAVKKVE